MSDYDEERREFRRKVELFYALEALKNNVSFQRLILNGFMREEVIHLTRIANKSMTAEEKLTRSNQAQAAFVLEDYFSRVRNEGEDAREKIPELDRLIEAQQEENQNEN
jgi:hypothetical protein